MKKHKQFLADLKVKNPIAFKGLIFLEEYKGARKPILVKDEYGITKQLPTNLLKGRMPTIKSAVNKHEYFLGRLKVENPRAFKELKFISTYREVFKKILVENQYGLCEITPSVLLRGASPDITSAINKTKYFINQSLEIYGEFYDYSKVNYINSRSHISVVCPVHGRFSVLPSNFLRGHGCALCGGASYYSGMHEDDFKEELEKVYGIVYYLKCWSDEEEFYKIGITKKDVETRFSGKFKMPYKYKILKIVETNLYEAIKLEKREHSLNKEKSYIPKISFGGYTECFSEIKIGG